MNIEDFCEQHDACEDGVEWARSTGCKTMAELWRREDMPAEYRAWIVTRSGVLTEGDLRLWCCWCVRQAWDLLDERSKKAVEVAKRYAVGMASEFDLSVAREYAREAYFGVIASTPDSVVNISWAALCSVVTERWEYCAFDCVQSAAVSIGTLAAQAAQAAELLRRCPDLFQEGQS